MKLSYELRVLPVALLALFCGVCLGRFPPGAGGGTVNDQPVVPAMAYAREEENVSFSDTAGDMPLPTPAPTPENLFSVSVVSHGDGGEYGLLPEPEPALDRGPEGTVNPGESATPAADAASAAPPAATPAPSSGFTLQVVQRPDSAPSGRRVLIYHTHTYEAYEKQTPTEYQETQRWRTADENKNVVEVGETLAGLLRGLGFVVEHDRTAFEPPELSTAYARSLDMLEKRAAAGERYDLYIDLHRDAASAGTGNTVSVGDTELARLMLLVGKGEGQTGQGFGEKPDWEANLEIAQRITRGLNAQADGLCKEVMVKSGRYNQHVAVGCVLIEAGTNLNTLPQALAAMPYLADAIDGALSEGSAP